MYICDVETTEQSATTTKHSSRHVESKRTITKYGFLKNGMCRVIKVEFPEDIEDRNPQKPSNNKTGINNNVSCQ
ncbi:hypothetical protein BDN70DRAFT_885916 [Pholiota conissans]|uniref:Uncharacterized protein n=1 Tax=Pholiota conissans TaxID=109636 RepID=A0A9P5YP68_9AGAR|nr:hypothetical protein BDN70DRAFT_885916 [Pholiota conissans]